jgi:hypothetical protein
MMLYRTLPLAALAAFAFASAASAQAPKAAAADAKRADVVKTTGDNFKQIDTNSDGSISREEIDAAGARERQSVAKTIETRVADRFRQLDTDKNGQLSMAEFQKTAPSLKPVVGSPGAQLMTQFDANKDGKISVAEFQGPVLTLFDRVDANKDGIVTSAERAAAQRSGAAKPRK